VSTQEHIEQEPYKETTVC